MDYAVTKGRPICVIKVGGRPSGKEWQAVHRLSFEDRSGELSTGMLPKRMSKLCLWSSRAPTREAGEYQTHPQIKIFHLRLAGRTD